MSLDQALRLHLTANFQPAESPEYVPTCKQALKAMERDEPDALVDLPDYRVITAGEAYDRFRFGSSKPR
jgi:hypothetical protein